MYCFRFNNCILYNTTTSLFNIPTTERKINTLPLDIFQSIIEVEKEAFYQLYCMSIKLLQTNFLRKTTDKSWLLSQCSKPILFSFALALASSNLGLKRSGI